MLTSATPAGPVVPSTGRLRPLGIDEVRFTEGFWAQRQQVNAAATLPHIAHWLEREGWIGNFDRAANGELPLGRRGREFSDSEVYKFLEASAWELGRSQDPTLERVFKEFVSRVGAAQEADGYLNTAFGRPGQPPRWSDLAWGHELYCLGHLLQAAVARGRTRPAADDGLIAIARRAADLVCEVFGEWGIQSVCGHAEIELGLVEFGRLTGESRYVEQARLFIDRRGRRTLPDLEWGRSYYQDDLPLREVTVLRGHAVRANYLAAGAVDVATETADPELLAALAEQWRRAIAARTYLTGGQGSHHQDEAFGDDWELPPDRAYAETCASVASIMFSWRLLLASGLPEYADHIERTLYNVLAAAVSHSGDAFFYTNTLHRRVAGAVPNPDQASSRALSSLRAPWFEVSCCPPNIARTIASLTGLVATTDANGLQLHQYASMRIRTALADGTGIDLAVETEYPSSGVVGVRVLRECDRPWTLSFRIPAWARDATLTYRPASGEQQRVRAETGQVALRAAFAPGDEIELVLDMPAEFVTADPRIDAVRGCLAVQRGPVVYCAESPLADPAGRDLDRLVVDPTVPPVVSGDRIVVQAAAVDGDVAVWPYRAGDPRPEPLGFGPLELLPYRDWGHRGPATMRVWLPTLTPRRPATP